MKVKNQTSYARKIFRILEELKETNPDIEISKHIVLATSDMDIFSMSDKELYMALQKHKTEMDINTLSDHDLKRAIDETEDLFKIVDEYDLDIRDNIYISGIDEYRFDGE